MGSLSFAGDFAPSLDTMHLVSRQDNPLAGLDTAAPGNDADLAQLTQGGNMSSRAYDARVYSLNRTQTGCNRQGALPVPLAANDTCLPGWLCTNSDFYNPPQYCPPTEPCHILRAGRMTCPPQGAFEPRICDYGFYCPPGGKESIPCPAGTFCPSGTVEPFNCSTGAICPAKSQRQIVVVPIGIMLVIDVALALFVLFGFGVSKWRKSRPKRYTTLEAGPNEDNIELLRSVASPSRASMQSVGRPPSLSVSAPPGSLMPGQMPAAQMPSPRSPYQTDGQYSPDPAHSPYGSNRPSPPTAHSPYTPPDEGFQSRSRASTLTARRAYGRADHMDGFADDDADSVYSALSEVGDDFHNSPDMLRFIRSMTKTIETSSIGLSFDFENLSFTTKKGKKILQEVTGTMPRGSCWGIMGGSGAGKSTFVNVLMGKQKNTGGTVKINGWEKDMSKYKKLIGYVPQDDIVFPELTVRENILHSARVRLPHSWRDKAIQDHVDSLIACLQLTHVQHSRVGDSRRPIISGGQRKRVNIGIELAAAPMAIFLDEPTSGLDATSAASIMRMIKAISRLGVTTIAIIHQPREQIFYSFDQLLLLAQGRSVYAGPTDEVQNYFENLGFAFPQRANPADTLIDIITGDGGQYTVGAGKRDTDVQTLIAAWTKKGQYGAVNKHLSTASSLDPETMAKRTRRISNQSLNSTVEQEQNLLRTMKSRGATWPAQVFYCFKRAMTQQVRNATSFFFEIVVGGLAGVIIGLSAFASNGHLFQGIYKPPFTILSSAVDYSSTPQIGLLGAMAIGLAASAPGFWVFGEEKQMYFRETASGHSRSAYYIGKLLSTFLRIGLSSLHFTVFLGVLATPMISFTHMYLAILAYFFDIYGLASVVSMVVKRENGPLIAVLLSLIFGVLGGVAPPLRTVKSWHMEWFWRMSPGVWFTEAFWTKNTTPFEYLYEVELASRSVGYTTGQYGLDVGMLVALGCIYRIVAYFGLIFVHRDRQR